MKERVLVVISARRNSLEKEIQRQVYPWLEQNEKEVADVYSLIDDVVEWHDKFRDGQLCLETDIKIDSTLQIAAIQDVSVQHAILILDRLAKIGCTSVFIPRLTERRSEIREVLEPLGITVHTDWSEQDETNRQKRQEQL